MPRCQAGVRSQRERSVTPTDVCACVCLCAPGNKVLAQVATNLIEDSYFGLTCLRFPPIVVAASAVYMAQLVVDCLPGVGQTVPTLPTELVRVVSPHAACACPLTALPALYLQPIGRATRDSSFAGVMHSHMDAVQGVWLLASRHRQQWWRGCTLLGTPCPHRVPHCCRRPPTLPHHRVLQQPAVRAGQETPGAAAAAGSGIVSPTTTARRCSVVATHPCVTARATTACGSGHVRQQLAVAARHTSQQHRVDTPRWPHGAPSCSG